MKYIYKKVIEAFSIRTCYALSIKWIVMLRSASISKEYNSIISTADLVQLGRTCMQIAPHSVLVQLCGILGLILKEQPCEFHNLSTNLMPVH